MPPSSSQQERATASASLESPDEPPSCGEAASLEFVVDAKVAADRQLDLAWIRQKLRAAITLLPRPVGRLGVRVLDDMAMTALHRRHCGDESTTDVLTFEESAAAADVDASDARTGPTADLANQPIRVDIAVCVDEAARQATVRGHRIEQELVLYVLHGLLHCCGFDDHDPDRFRAMHAEEDRILTAIGVGATFGGEA